MLTEKQYQALCGFRDNFVPATGKPNGMTMDLCERGFIRIRKIEYTEENECVVFYVKTFWELTTRGKQALENFEEQLRKDQANRDANQRTENKRHLANILETLAIGTISAIIAGLVLYYWANIIAFLQGLIH